MKYLLVLAVMLTGCSISSMDSDKVDMQCMDGYDQVVGDINEKDTIFVCTDYKPKGSVDGEVEGPG